MATLTKIGNSFGVRIPKILIEKAHLQNVQIDFEVVNGGLLLRPLPATNRTGWEANIDSVIEANSGSEDCAIDPDWLNDSDLDQWEW